MSLEQARQFADQAAQSLTGGQPSLALELAEQALMLKPDFGEALNLRGIALSLLGRSAEAEEGFRRAMQFSPAAKPVYNLAVHRFRNGDREGALDLTQIALEREPDHTMSFALQQLLTGKEGGGFIPRPPAPHLDWSHVGFNAEETSFVADWPGKSRLAWLITGGFLTALHAVIFVVALLQVQRDGQIGGSIAILYLLSYLCGLAFLLVHSMNRRRSIAWTVAYAFTGCVTGFLVLPAYLLTDRSVRK